MLRNLLLCIAFLIPTQEVIATCTILNSKGQSAAPTSDELGRLLQTSNNCPTEVFTFRDQLNKSGLTIETTMVANRGFHNPTEGSFSLFEMATGPNIKKGEFFFGHFTAINAKNQLIADQNPKKDGLMIEAFAWDPKKQYFNFYELRGDGNKGQWFYRGDSADILADNAWLHRQPDPKHPQFGDRLRCSACHNGGGPIMKELEAPHNDWWEPKRLLDFGGRKPDVVLQEMLNKLISADRLAHNVKLGLNKLNTSPGFAQKINALSLQEQLRPLFCPNEINFESDPVSNDVTNSTIEIPVEFFVDSRLLSQKQKLEITRTQYQNALNSLGSHFPETTLQDADHAWLTPVKSTSDKMAAEHLIEVGLIDSKFMANVLSIDFTNPVFSNARCDLLTFIPSTKTPDWRLVFEKNLSQSQNPAAKQLLQNLRDPKRTLAYHQKKTNEFIQQCKANLNKPNQVEKLVRLLTQKRDEIRTSEISANPLGQILEPGFRVIFPENKKTEVLNLSSNCEL